MLNTEIEKILKELNLSNIEGLDLSSLELISLAVYIERKYKIRFELDELNKENFQSVDAIAKLLESKLK